MQGIPTELQQHILCYLSLQDLGNANRVCPLWYKLISENISEQILEQIRNIIRDLMGELNNQNLSNHGIIKDIFLKQESKYAFIKNKQIFKDANSYQIPLLIKNIFLHINDFDKSETPMKFLTLSKTEHQKNDRISSIAFIFLITAGSYLAYLFIKNLYNYSNS